MLYKLVDYETVSILSVLTDKGWAQIGGDDYAHNYIQRQELEKLSGKHREKYRGILELEEIYYIGRDYEAGQVEGYQHGQKGECPTCGTLGVFDLSREQYPEFEYWIAKNMSNSVWECHSCWLK